MGTVDFMAPEQGIDSRRVDHRADIYSLGCTLCYLRTGRAPFAGATAAAKLMAHHDQAPSSLPAGRVARRRENALPAPRAAEKYQERPPGQEPLALNVCADPGYARGPVRRSRQAERQAADEPHEIGWGERRCSCEHGSRARSCQLAVDVALDVASDRPFQQLPRQRYRTLDMEVPRIVPTTHFET
jgi:serine/threonine protein kinase